MDLKIIITRKDFNETTIHDGILKIGDLSPISFALDTPGLLYLNNNLTLLNSQDVNGPNIYSGTFQIEIKN